MVEVFDDELSLRMLATLVPRQPAGSARFEGAADLAFLVGVERPGAFVRPVRGTVNEQQETDRGKNQICHRIVSPAVKARLILVLILVGCSLT
jgi:hypothetical protein